MNKSALRGRQESPFYKGGIKVPTSFGQNDISSKLYSQDANSGL